MQRFAIFAVAAIVTGLVVGVVIAGGDEGTGTPSVPELKPPPGSIEGANSGTTDRTTTTDTTTETTPAPAQTTPTDPSGGVQAPESDTPQNDVAPPENSPADRFEQFCQDNPGAC